ncbi:Transcriptional regulator, ArsR family [Xenorhabdus bovienii str. puntauvense]|uniref:Transcriptional regulator, ArsR family n=1 Tax=Xenorhabdus bovienii str. puntauvense TaxID=1398201 RepID=A0A077N7R9_XENBV|nr:metalloregulator ArsR/SmtB family transcription factor [Xenorhabdus bovienii]MCG3462870.1 helix-turn-helix domain-containing protein [Xenorhabdus bovienii]CDG98241.1 Transcriptional regulator, ArsR family [Xenorhabdus bovienii str. puntauvense]
MDKKNNLNQIATSIGHPSRIAILSLLMAGQALTAKELAYSVGIEPSTTTNHLNILIKSNLITFIRRGRYKYFQLANNEVAHLLESMMVLGPPIKVQRKLPNPDLCTARFCYDHIAGFLGTSIYKFLISQNFILQDNNHLVLNKNIDNLLNLLRVDNFEDLCRGRKIAYACIDWSERTPHIAGALGTALAYAFIDNKWIKRRENSRVIEITTLGKISLSENFNINIDEK